MVDCVVSYNPTNSDNKQSLLKNILKAAWGHIKESDCIEVYDKITLLLNGFIISNNIFLDKLMVLMSRFTSSLIQHNVYFVN